MRAKILELDSCPSQPIDRDTVAIVREFEPRQIVQLAVKNGATHIVQKNAREFEQELRVANAMMFRSNEFLSDPLSFIMSEKVKNLFQVDCAAVENKKEPLGKLEKYIASLPGSRSIISEVLSSSEEIFTNALKNTGTFYKRLENVNPSKVAREGRVSLMAATSHDVLYVGCVDSFGLLDVPALMSRILACFDKGISGSINMGAGGAGIGTFLVFSFAMNMYIAVEKNKKTAVFCSYPLGLRMKDFELLPKNLHLLYL